MRERSEYDYFMLDMKTLAKRKPSRGVVAGSAAVIGVLGLMALLLSKKLNSEPDEEQEEEEFPKLSWKDKLFDWLGWSKKEEPKAETSKPASITERATNWFKGLFPERKVDPASGTQQTEPGLQTSKVPTEVVRTTPMKATELSSSAKLAKSWVEGGQVEKPTLDALSEASMKSGVPKNVLYAFAFKESRFGKILNNRTSSARGLLQLLPRTFNEMVDKHGKQFGIRSRDIDDDRASALMGAMYIKRLAGTYQRAFGSAPSVTDAYLLYLMGPTGGVSFLKSMMADSSRDAAAVYPKEARANPSVFFKDAARKEGRTFAEVYSYLKGEVGDVASAFIPPPVPITSIIPVATPISEVTPVGGTVVFAEASNTTPIVQKINVSAAIKAAPVPSSSGGSSASVSSGSTPTQVASNQASDVNFIRDKQGRVYAL